MVAGKYWSHMEGTAEMSDRGREKVVLLDIDMVDERLFLLAIILLFLWDFPHI